MKSKEAGYSLLRAGIASRVRKRGGPSPLSFATESALGTPLLPTGTSGALRLSQRQGCGLPDHVTSGPAGDHRAQMEVWEDRTNF